MPVSLLRTISNRAVEWGQRSEANSPQIGALYVCEYEVEAPGSVAKRVCS